MDIMEFAAHSGRMEAWEAWRTSDLGKETYEMLQLYARPAGMSKIDAESGLYLHGVQVGYTMLLDMLFKLDKVAEGIKARLKLDSQVLPDYGAEAILQEMQDLLQTATETKPKETSNAAD